MLIILVVVAIVAYFIISKPIPHGTLGYDAEKLADKMLKAINKPAFDTLTMIEFTFQNKHHYQWDKQNNQVSVSWKGNQITLDLTRSPEVWRGKEKKAYNFFINDSFWLVAPFKVRDEGVVRSIVKLPKGKGTGLLVKYTTGGLTPGDHYLWILNDEGIPMAWRLWTSNLFIGGVETTWENWKILQNISFSCLHKNSYMDIGITQLKVK